MMAPRLAPRPAPQPAPQSTYLDTAKDVEIWTRAYSSGTTMDMISLGEAVRTGRDNPRP